MLIKLDPIWVYFCITNHNLILIIVMEIHNSSWTKRATVSSGSNPVAKLKGGQVVIKRNSKEMWQEVLLMPCYLR